VRGGERTVAIADPADVDAALAQLRGLLHDDVDPDAVQWSLVGDAQAALFGAPAVASAPSTAAPPPRLPRAFVALARQALLHDDAERHRLVHRLARDVQRERAAWLDTLRPDRLQLERLAQQVRREIHKMHAFVRFRPLPDADGDVRHVAWFEPAHHVLRAATPFFVRRFATMRWAILTPRGCADWDCERLRFGPAAARSEAPAADDGEALWLAYYRSIFNPARVKVAMMRREMPVRFWRNLPEAAAIAPLLRAAPARVQAMVERPDGERTRRRGACVQPAPAAGTDPLAALARRAAACDRCAFAADATQTVWGEGRPGAALMLVGEQPGDREDLEGRPFVGPAGELLHAAIRQLGWPRERLYLTNAVKHFKYEWRGKRRLHKTAAQREAETCSDWLQAEIDAVRPRALVALGATAARSLLGRDVAIEAHAGRWLVRADGLRVLVAHHPAAVLRGAGIDEARWHAELAPAGAVLAERAVPMQP
jgi:probable DNA metabolism protein